MLYPLTQDLLVSVVYTVFFGLCFGAFAVGLKTLFELVGEIIMIPSRIIKASAGLSQLKTYCKTKISIKREKGKIACAVTDFIISVAFAIVFILVSYISSDGIFRFYILLTFSIVSYLSNLIVSKAPKRAITFIFKLIIKASTALFALLIIPIMFTCKAIYRNITNRYKIRSNINKKRKERGNHYEGEINRPYLCKENSGNYICSFDHT